jgi:CcmD family protein
MPRNLILAYIATWLIHGSYVLYLFSRNKKLKRAEEKATNN